MAKAGAKVVPEADPAGPLPALRAKYLDLCRKYTALVERTERRTMRDLSRLSLSRWTLASMRGGIALVREGRIELTNRLFQELARAGSWEVAGRRMAPAPLRHLVLTCAAEMEGSGVQSSEWRIFQGKRTLSMHLERPAKDQRVLTVAVNDVTDDFHQEARLRRARDWLIQQERLRMLGEAAAAVAHDLGSTLRSLAFQLATIETDGQLNRKHQRSFRALAEGLEQAAAVVRRLHEFARAGSLHQELVNPGIILQQALAMFELENVGDGAVQVRTRLGDLPFVRGTAAELSHLFLNLLRNARDAMRSGGGAITVEAQVTRRQILIDVADEGEGVSAENMSNLFQPFFTTKSDRGTGLGLWLAAGTMRRMRGTITAHHQKRGMLFRVTMPRAEAISRAPRRERRRGSSG